MQVLFELIAFSMLLITVKQNLVIFYQLVILDFFTLLLFNVMSLNITLMCKPFGVKTSQVFIFENRSLL